MDEEMILKGAAALAALSVDHPDCATSHLAGLTQLQLVHLANTADYLGQVAARLAREPVQLPLHTERPDHTHDQPARPVVIEFDMDHPL